VLDLKCRECGQTFKTPAELEEHMDRLHQVSKKGGADVAPDPPPNEVRR
jgi:C2H2 type zinc finger protein